MYAKMLSGQRQMAISKLTSEIIDAAIFGFEEQRRKLDEQIAELRAMRGGASQGASRAARGGKRKMSAAGRKAIAEAQRKRWAEQKSASDEVAAPKPARKKKRRLSPEGRAAIVAAAKKRWAARRAAAKQ
jgi:hypothetical protein